LPTTARSLSVPSSGLSTTAVYSATGNFAGNTSPSLTQTVQTVAYEPDPLYAGKKALVVGGTPGNDNILITPSWPRSYVQVNVQETNLSRYRFSGSYDTSNVDRLMVYGGPGNDDITVDDDITLPTLLDGGAGDDVLKGGGGPNILIGGDGNDTLLGGSFRNLLIGGLGQDKLKAGPGQDILIGGTTNFDSNAAALAAIMAEWSRTNLDYDDRVNHILHGGGLNGSTVLNSTTIQNDKATDILMGGSGLDLYFASSADQLVGKTKGETVVSI
jgi:Ca2+-binding RTX toxin-like protein